MKKIVFLMLAAGVMMMVGCKKTEEGEGPSGGTDTVVQPTEQRVEEYIYIRVFKFHRVDDTTLIPWAAFVDTVAKHGADAHVKQIYIKPDDNAMWSMAGENQMETYANRLRDMYISSNTKLSGENTTLVLDSVVFHNLSVQNVLHDTLRINLVQR